jgi:hypothetical protein
MKHKLDFGTGMVLKFCHFDEVESKLLFLHSGRIFSLISPIFGLFWPKSFDKSWQHGVDGTADGGA